MPGEFAPGHIVARDLDGSPITWSGLCARVDFWCARLRLLPGPKIAVHHSNSIEFISIVFGLWRLNRIPVIPANTLDATLDAITAETDCFVGEFGHRSAAIDQTGAETPAMITEMPQTDVRQTALIMFTSGSTGAPTAIHKSFEQLNGEMVLLETQWGREAAGTLTLGTVSHHHMYGLPFRLLWPLVSGRPFLNQGLIYLEQLLALRQFRSTLISSPAHLDHLPETLDWPAVQRSIQRVFSAGAPLSPAAAESCSQRMSAVITEIYGSTETGAVAFRDPVHAGPWQPLPGVTVKSVQGKLAVNSPAVDRDRWLVTEDLCEIDAGGRFRLTGRADRIVKVAGKRVSLTAIESALGAHPWVEKVAILLLQQRKSRIGAVVRLTDQGIAALVDRGRRAIGKELLAGLKDSVEPVALPRYWRFVSTMPVNPQGKTTASELAPLFDDDNRPRYPQILETVTPGEPGDLPDEALVRFVVPQDLLYLEGHFPGKPILPGVVQVGWAIHYSRQWLGNTGEFRRLEALKFQRVIQPGERIALHLKLDRNTGKLTFSYASGDVSHSSGRVVFAGAD